MVRSLLPERPEGHPHQETALVKRNLITEVITAAHSYFRSLWGTLSWHPALTSDLERLKRANEPWHVQLLLTEYTFHCTASLLFPAKMREMISGKKYSFTVLSVADYSVPLGRTEVKLCRVPRCGHASQCPGLPAISGCFSRSASSLQSVSSSARVIREFHVEMGWTCVDTTCWLKYLEMILLYEQLNKIFFPGGWNPVVFFQNTVTWRRPRWLGNGCPSWQWQWPRNVLMPKERTYIFHENTQMCEFIVTERIFSVRLCWIDVTITSRKTAYKFTR